MNIKTFAIAENGTCELVRGDNAQFDLQIFEQGAKVESFNATFSVKQYLDDSSYLFQVTFDESTPCIIDHNTTQNLPYGNYWYDVQIIYTDKDGNTQYKTIGAFPFVLKPDVTG